MDALPLYAAWSYMTKSGLVGVIKFVNIYTETNLLVIGGIAQGYHAVCDLPCLLSAIYVVRLLPWCTASLSPAISGQQVQSFQGPVTYVPKSFIRVIF